MLLAEVLLLIRVLFALVLVVHLLARLGVGQRPDGGYACGGGAEAEVCDANGVLFGGVTMSMAGSRYKNDH